MNQGSSGHRFGPYIPLHVPLPELPARGDFDLTEVLKSPYFFA